MLTRQQFNKAFMALAGTAALPATQGVAMAAESKAWRMPDEAEPHVRTWMAFGASKAVWGNKLHAQVQRDLAGIALAIAKFEPVSMLVRSADMATAKALMGTAVNLIEAPIDDLWMRDMGPVFVSKAQGDKAAVDFNFNGWGQKQDFENDAKVAAMVAQKLGMQRLKTSLVLEGGGIEVDGHGTAIITESCLLNANRNPGVGKSACEAELKRLLGINKVIWLPGIKGKDITDGHTDFYARFTVPGTVVAAYDPDPESFDHAVTKRHVEILKSATDARGRKLEVVVLQAPTTVRERYKNSSFAAGYINFYVCNGAVILPEFGDAAADGAAKATLKRLFASREIVQINIDAIAAGGGGIHCTTQQQPA